MVNVRYRIRRNAYSALSVVAALLIVFLPLTVSYADEGCVPPSSTTPGVHQPVGADAPAFTYNCDTGLWESEHYTYNPASGSYSPKDPVVYTYNPSTGGYDTTSWVYNVPQAIYLSVTQSVSQPPAGATVVGGPTISNTGAGSNNTVNDNGGVSSGASINQTGANSNNTIDGSADNNQTHNSQTSALINNQLQALATTGNAVVLGNVTGGNATSGNAQDLANIVNMLQSSSNALGGDTVTFVANIDGDVNGDLLLDPNMLGLVQSGVNDQLGNTDLTLNNEVDATINNDIDLTVASGAATVADNGTGGNATTGSAKAIANVVNLINSAITSGRSFMGVININGNLNGDILVPPDFVDQLIANNVPTVTIDTTGANSNNAITTNNGSHTTDITNSNDLGINNGVSATANTGQADVSGNGTGGNATSGQARTSITAFNLTGSNVIGANSLLVFVNVAGEWVGMIVDAPPGTTAAALGGGITQSQNRPANHSTSIDNDVNLRINNDIDCDASSGNASVNNNGTGGNANTGDADCVINLLNVENSSLSLSGWFGILFINVFGRWNGSFGINTSAGDPIATAGMGSGASNSSAAQVFSFIPRQPGAGSSFNVIPFTAGSTTTPGNTDGSVPAAKKLTPGHSPTTQAPRSNINQIIIAFTALTILFFAAEAINDRRTAKSTT